MDSSSAPPPVVLKHSGARRGAAREEANMSTEVVIDGLHLTVEQVVEVARGRARVRLASAARARVERCRAVVDTLLESGTKVYGLTTGFGSKRDVFIDRSEVRQLQRNLIMSHACGVGRPLDEDQARATMLLRAHTLARGVSGVRPVVIEALLYMLNAGIYPYIPCKGSLGASGDLAPLSHLGLVLMGHPAGKVYGQLSNTANSRGFHTVEEPDTRTFVSSTPELLRQRFGFEPLELEAKEGLAINNGTQMMSAIGCLTLYDTERLVRSAEIACALSIEAMQGITAALDARLHDVRPYVGQIESAANLRKLVEGSEILAYSLNTALIERAQRHLDEAMAHLGAEGSHDATAVREGIGEVVQSLRQLRADPARVVDELAQQSASRSTPSHRAAQNAAFRQALSPMKAALQAMYRELLSIALSDEAVKSREACTQALDALEKAVPNQPRVQDDYSTRCMPQVAGAVRTVLAHVRENLTVEINSATDNPLIFPPEAPLELPIESYRAGLTVGACVDAVTSGGNFHGEVIAFLMDYLALGAAEIGNISERRTAHITDGNLNNGLPSLLIWKSGLNSGFMIPQYTAASLVSENKVLTHPASTDSIPSCENTEDHVSMGSIAARKARAILENVEYVVGIELLNAFQALQFRRPFRPGPAARSVCSALEQAGILPVEEDRPLYEDMEMACRLVRQGVVLRAAESAVGPLH
jgi:histidine ammonia-lyase